MRQGKPSVGSAAYALPNQQIIIVRHLSCHVKLSNRKQETKQKQCILILTSVKPKELVNNNNDK